LTSIDHQLTSIDLQNLKIKNFNKISFNFVFFIALEIRMPANLKAYKRILLSKLGAAFPQIESGTMNTFNESNPDLFQEIKGNCLNK